MSGRPAVPVSPRVPTSPVQVPSGPCVGELVAGEGIGEDAPAGELVDQGAGDVDR